MDVQGRHLVSLTSLRFFAALLVFLRHTVPLFDQAGVDTSTVLIQGTVGVSFFFILSGFVLTWSRDQALSAVDFYRRRFARVWPNHAVTWLVALGLALTSGVGVSAWRAGLNLVLLQAWVNDQSVNLSVNSVSWSLSCEAFFYACFPFIAVAALRVQRPRAALAVAAFGTWCVAGIVELSPFAPTTKLWLVYFFPPTRALEFVVGILACRLVLEGRAPRIRLTAAAAFATAAYLLAGNLPWRLDLAGYAAVTLIPFALVIVAATQRDVAGATPWLLRSNAAVTLGRWSFAFYLVHFTILTELADHLLSPTSSITSVVLVILLALGLSVAASGLLHELVERPVERRLRHGRRRVPEVA